MARDDEYEEPNSLGIEVRLRQEKPIPLDVSFACNPDEVLVLAGPSGSGKTTVLRAVAGLYRARYARVVCRGAVWDDMERGFSLPAHRRRIGLVFQNYALFPHRNALGNIMESLLHLPMPSRRQTAYDLLRRVRLDGLENRYPESLSGGQQQRVAIARALARDPDVLLLDEPFSAVDQVTRRRLYRELLELRRSLSIPVILVTHDLDEAALLADRLCVLHHGVTLQSGPPQMVADRPINATVARLMDQPNIFQGVCLGHDEALKKTFLRWRDTVLEAPYRGDIHVSEVIDWMIPPASILLHRRRDPVPGDRENPLFGTVGEFMVWGGLASFQVEIDADRRVMLCVPLHVAKRNGLANGETVGISLLTEGIHLMSRERPGSAQALAPIDTKSA